MIVLEKEKNEISNVNVWQKNFDVVCKNGRIMFKLKLEGVKCGVFGYLKSECKSIYLFLPMDMKLEAIVHHRISKSLSLFFVTATALWSPLFIYSFSLKDKHFVQKVNDFGVEMVDGYNESHEIHQIVNI